jgi:osmotically-inducible protein OsmY
MNSGIAPLTGSVRWPRERSDAETVVRAIDGVARVVKYVTVANAANPAGFEMPECR